MDSATRADKILLTFEAHQIQLVEWENYLLRRLGYPTVPSVRNFHLSHFVSDTVDD
jgi:hypothetical protein